MAEALRLNRAGAAHALVLEGVSRTFGALVALDKVDLTVGAGERRGILGANGAGKTTLFNAITGDFPSTAGRIRFFGEDVTTLPPYERIRRGMRRTYQNSMLFRGLSVLDNLYLACRGVTAGRFSFIRPRQDDAALESARDLAHAVHLDGVADTAVSDLSHGQQRQLEIGMALSGAPRLILFDEPAAGLSPAERRDLVQILSALPRHISFVIIEHEADMITNGYWGHPAYKLPPEVNLLAVAHYLEALDWQRDVIRLHTVFGGKNPHPNFLVGGMASAINLDSTATINAERITDIAAMIKHAREFVEQVYWPDLVAIAGFYKEWGAIGGGVPNFLACGEFPEADIRDLDKLYFPRGIILDKDLTKVHEYDHKKVQEFIHSSWYEYSKGPEAGLHPFDGETAPKYTGPATPWTYLQDEAKYTWMKAPRYEGKPMQVGPLARMLVAYGKGHPDVKELVGEALGKLQVGPEVLFSTLGRTAARGIETVLLARKMEQWLGELTGRIKNGDVATFTKDKWEPSSWPAKAEGYGFLDAPRGSLGHWVQIENGKIARYQCVVPSTWNCSPRDAQGQEGPYEASLQDNHPLADPERPLEILRTIHSFDPCMACGVHVLDAEGREVVEVKVQ